MSGEEGLSRQEIEALIETRVELGKTYEPALIESFTERVETAVASRVDAEIEDRKADRREQAAHEKRKLALAIVSLVTGIPITAITLNTGPGGDMQIVSTMVAWGGIAVVNIAHALRGGRGGR